MYSSRIFLKLAYLPVKGRELMKYTKLVMEVFIWLCLLKHLQNSILYTVFFFCHGIKLLFEKIYKKREFN